MTTSKRMRRGEMLDFLRGKRRTVATSKQLGESGEFLTRALRHDPDAYLTPAETDRIMAAYQAVALAPSRTLAAKGR